MVAESKQLSIARERHLKEMEERVGAQAAGGVTIAEHAAALRAVTALCIRAVVLFHQRSEQIRGPDTPSGSPHRCTYAFIWVCS